MASYRDRIPAVLRWFTGYPESLATVDPHLATLDLPVQVFWGDRDQLLHLDNGERLDARLPRSRLHVFRECGHFCYQDRHEDFARLVAGWVGGGFAEI
nr:alpha/beta fold hydrolase [Rubrimonas cliftonensis]